MNEIIRELGNQTTNIINSYYQNEAMLYVVKAHTLKYNFIILASMVICLLAVFLFNMSKGIEQWEDV